MSLISGTGKFSDSNHKDHLKIKKIGTPEKIVVIIIKFKQFDLILPESNLSKEADEVSNGVDPGHTAPRFVCPKTEHHCGTLLILGILSDTWFT